MDLPVGKLIGVISRFSRTRRTYCSRCNQVCPDVRTRNPSRRCHLRWWLQRLPTNQPRSSRGYGRWKRPTRTWSARPRFLPSIRCTQYLYLQPRVRDRPLRWDPQPATGSLPSQDREPPRSLRCPPRKGFLTGCRSPHRCCCHQRQSPIPCRPATTRGLPESAKEAHRYRDRVHSRCRSFVPRRSWSSSHRGRGR